MVSLKPLINHKSKAYNIAREITRGYFIQTDNRCSDQLTHMKEGLQGRLPTGSSSWLLLLVWLLFDDLVNYIGSLQENFQHCEMEMSAELCSLEWKAVCCQGALK